MSAIAHHHDLAPQPSSGWPPGVQLAAFGLCVAQAVFIAAAFVQGEWLLDADGAKIADDFAGFWAAGRLVLQGHGAVYDWALHKAATVAAVGHDFSGVYPLFYPPHYFLLVALAALPPFTFAHVAWVALTPLPYIYVVARILNDRLGVLLALAFPALLANAMIGQNGCLTAALIGGALIALERGRPVLAGCLIGLLTYKPHFGVLFPLALICASQWRAFASAAATTAALAVVSALVLGADAWTGFADALRTANRNVFGNGTADYAKMQSTSSTVRALGGGVTLAWMIHGTAAALMSAWVFVAWRGQTSFALKAAILSVGAVVCAPHAYMYDLVVLAVPAAFLLRDGRERGFLRYELAALAGACLLLLSFPLFKAPLGLGATLIVAALIARRWIFAAQR
mgnify:FL=1